MATAENDHQLAHEIAQEALATAFPTKPETQPPAQENTGHTLITITAGTGGDEAHDWTQMLAEMYSLWAKLNSLTTVTLDAAPGDRAGYRTVTLQVDGKDVLHTLQAEKGVHRLVRNSPFDPANRRHTAFASVQVYPAPSEHRPSTLPESELDIKTFRSSGPGGQHMQKASTAVRITHKPTGLNATCQSERSQSQNILTAKKILQARVGDHNANIIQQQQKAQRSETPTPSWGNRTRSYFLHPKEMVNDHRTGNKTPRAKHVLQGHLELIH